MARQSESRSGGQVAQDDSVVSQPPPPAESGRALRIAALVTTAVGLAALTAGACVLSYEPIHHLAIQSGVTSRLATIYPLIFDALLVLAGCSVLALRGAGLVSRIYAWLCLLVLLVGLAGGGAVHAAGVRFSRKLGGVLAAVLPWVLVLIGFGLLLALLRYIRLRRQASRASYAEQLTAPLPPASPDAALANGPAVPAPRPAPPEAPVRNPALAALAIARPQAEPATAPQPTVIPVLAPQPPVAPQPTLAPQPAAAPQPALAPQPAAAPQPALAPQPPAAPQPTLPQPAVASVAGSGQGTPGQEAPGREPASPGAPAARPAGADLTKSGPAGEPGQRAGEPGQRARARCSRRARSACGRARSACGRARSA